VVQAYAATTPPTGYSICDGSSKLRSGTDPDGKNYAALFAVIGTTFGSADGTHFNLPNLKGRVPVGLDSSQTEFDAMAETGGAKTHTLTTAQMPAHIHTSPNHSHKGIWFGAGVGGYRTSSSHINNASGAEIATVYNSGTNALGTGDTAATINSTGGDGSHPNLQPYLVLQYIIKL